MKSDKEFADRYCLLRLLGRGTGGVTYLVRDAQDSNSLQVLKYLPAGSEAVLRKALKNECEILSQLDHPHIARILNYGEWQQQPYYTSEYVDGENFVAACRARSWNGVFAAIVQTCWGLDYLHQQGILHRDLKPDNILVGKLHAVDSQTSSERLFVKVIDFGLASAVKGVSEVGAGTLPYMAPEVLQGQASSIQSDLYSWGLVLYEMALGRMPKRTGRFADYLQSLANGELAWEQLQQAETPVGILALIRQCTARDPAQRAVSAGELIRILNKSEQENFSLQLRISTEQEPLAENSVSEQIPELSAPTEIISGMLEHLRSGKKQLAWRWIEHFFSQMEAVTELQLADPFFGAAIQSYIERGDFSQANKCLARVEALPVYREQVSLEISLQGILIDYYQGHYEAAWKRVGQVDSNLELASGFSPRARFKNIVGMVLQMRQEYLLAAQAFTEASDLAQKAERLDLAASFLVNEGTLWQDQGKWSLAFEKFKQAETMARKLRHDTLLANVLSNLGNLYLYFGRLRDAEAVFLESNQLAERHGLKPLLAYNLYLLAVGEDEKGNWEQVALFLKDAVESTRSSGDSRPYLQALLAQGYFYFHQDKQQACQTIIDELQASSMRSEQEFYQSQAEWLAVKMKLKNQDSDLSGAAEVLARNSQSSEARNQKHTLWQICSDQGELALLQGEVNAAKEFFEKSLEIISSLREEVPEVFRKSFYRDRKKEKIRKFLKKLVPLADEEDSSVLQDETIDFVWDTSPKKSSVVSNEIGELVMTNTTMTEGKSSPQGVSLSFQKWTEINRRLLSQQNVDALLEEILDAAIDFTDAERGFVIHSQVGAFKVHAARNLDQKSLESPEGEFSRTIAQEVLRKGKSMVIMDALGEERFQEAQSIHAMQIRSVLCVPLKQGHRTVGLVYLDNRIRQGVFQEKHLPLLEALTDQASLALEHAHLHEEDRKKLQIIEQLNGRLEKELVDTSASLDELREGMKREHEGLALRYSYDKIIGKSEVLKKVLLSLDRLIDSNVSVFIFGESGTGKELIAQAIHYNSPRRDRPFVSENVAALSENLLESELFGHVKGAFTGADRDRIGLFQMANGGTLFLDEIGEMPMAMQAKLLRVLQEGEVKPVGGTEYRKIDIRVVCASHQDIKIMSETGKFRMDLFYRLNGLRVNLPTLRQRREDIPLLVKHFLELVSLEEGGVAPQISREAMRTLTEYFWPGNIRELQNEVKRFCVLGVKKIKGDMLSPHIIAAVKDVTTMDLRGGLDVMIADVEKRAIVEAMEKYAGNKVKAARALKITRRTLYAKLKAYQLG